MELPDHLELRYEKIQTLRYGENSHQSAAFYRRLDTSNNDTILAQKQGKELSYNNIVDADSAWNCAKFIAKQFCGRYVCVIVKHNNPCGVAVANSYIEAYEKAYSTDKVSAFGGIIAFAYVSICELIGKSVDIDDVIIGKILVNQFVEVIVASNFTEDALEVAKKKCNVRLLEMSNVMCEENTNNNPKYEIKTVYGDCILYQTMDDRVLSDKDIVIKSVKVPDVEMLEQMRFAWCIAKYVKSNAIVFVRDWMTVGIGAGQMSRVDSTRLAIMKAGVAGLDVAGCVVASDAFFPFRDGVDTILDSGAIGIIQPGGSIKDKEVIAAADEKGAIMVMTGIRHFRH